MTTVTALEQLDDANTTFAQDLIASMTEAAAHARGDETRAREHVIEVPDVRAIREALGLSQSPGCPMPRGRRETGLNGRGCASRLTAPTKAKGDEP